MGSELDMISTPARSLPEFYGSLADALRNLARSLVQEGGFTLRFLDKTLSTLCFVDHIAVQVLVHGGGGDPAASGGPETIQECLRQYEVEHSRLSEASFILKDAASAVRIYAMAIAEALPLLRPTHDSTICVRQVKAALEELEDQGWCLEDDTMRLEKKGARRRLPAADYSRKPHDHKYEDNQQLDGVVAATRSANSMLLGILFHRLVQGRSWSYGLMENPVHGARSGWKVAEAMKELRCRLEDLEKGKKWVITEEVSRARNLVELACWKVEEEGNGGKQGFRQLMNELKSLDAGMRDGLDEVDARIAGLFDGIVESKKKLLVFGNMHSYGNST